MRGAVVIAKHKDGSYHAQAWPVNHTGGKGPRQQHIRDNWALMNAQAPALDAQTKVQMRALSKNTIFRPTDLELMLMAGKLWEIWTKDGRVIRPVKLMASEIQTYLDSISTTVGTILYRSSVAWEALLPGNDGEVLTTHGPGTDPVWAAASPGGLQRAYQAPASGSTSSGAEASKGTSFTPVVDFKMYGAWAWCNFIAGGTYQASLWTLNVRTLDTLVAQSTPFSPDSSGTADAVIDFETPAQLSAGQLYWIALSRLDAGDTYTLPVATTNASYGGAPIAAARQDLFIAKATPAAGDTLSLFTGAGFMGFTWSD